MNNNDFTRNSIEAFIRVGMLLLLGLWCFTIIQPFIIPVVWGIIIAVAVYPPYLKLRSLLGGNNTLASVVYTLIALAILIVPTVLVTDSLIETSVDVGDKYEAGELNIPPPSEQVRQWPLIGEQVYDVWTEASDNMQETLKHYRKQVKKVVEFSHSTTAGMATTVLLSIFSVILSGIMIANAKSSYQLTCRIFSRLTDGDKGALYTDLSTATIRSVAQGVLGIALIQALLGALGMMVMDVPAWGVWTVIVLFLAIAQVPPWLVLIPVSIYVFDHSSTTVASIYLVYNIIVSFLDGVLKPMMIGRGMSTPMPVILLGAIGGMITSGIIGLFVGAIVLALGYELFMAWLRAGEEASEQVQGEGTQS